jgi:hypothetical protein
VRSGGGWSDGGSAVVLREGELGDSGRTMNYILSIKYSLFFRPPTFLFSAASITGARHRLLDKSTRTDICEGVHILREGVDTFLIGITFVYKKKQRKPPPPIKRELEGK